jgi:hypothetical protein
MSFAVMIFSVSLVGKELGDPTAALVHHCAAQRCSAAASPISAS